MPPLDLAKPINVRLPKALLEHLESVSEEEGVPVSILVRRAVMLRYSGFNLSMDGTNNAEDGSDYVVGDDHSQQPRVKNGRKGAAA